MFEENRSMIENNEWILANTPPERENNGKYLMVVLASIISFIALVLLVLADVLRIPLLEETLKTYSPKSFIYSLAIPGILLLIMLFVFFRRKKPLGFLIFSLIYLFASFTSVGLYVMQKAEDVRKYTSTYDELHGLIISYEEGKIIGTKNYTKQQYGRYLKLLTTYYNFIQRDVLNVKDMNKIYSLESQNWIRYLIKQSNEEQYASITKMKITDVQKSLVSIEELIKKREKSIGYFKNSFNQLNYKEDIQNRMMKSIDKKTSEVLIQKGIIVEYQSAYQSLNEFNETDAKLLKESDENAKKFEDDYDYIKKISSTESLNQAMEEIDQYWEKYEDTYDARLNNTKSLMKEISDLKSIERKNDLIKTIKIVEGLFLTKHKEIYDAEKVIILGVKEILHYLKQNRKEYIIVGGRIMFYSDKSLREYNKMVNDFQKELDQATKTQSRVEKELKEYVSKLFNSSLMNRIYKV